MKVKALIEELGKLDGDMEVLCYAEDEELVAKGHLFRLLDIEDVDTVHAEICRDADQVPTLKIGRSARSELIATINVSSDF